jgi:toxin-antitoxin system PIN domain toxin
VNAVALLDVNILVALFDSEHIHHELAHDWFSDHKQYGWATCAVTENGFVRIVTRPEYASPPNRPEQVLAGLRAFRKSSGHHFWANSLSLADERIFNPAFIRGHRQVTDIYLLGLAKTNGGCLATFDQTIPIAAVKGATKALLQVITAA